MELKKEILKLIQGDSEFRNEIKYLLDINEIEDSLDDLNSKVL